MSKSKYVKLFSIALFSVLFATSVQAKDVEVEAIGVGNDYNWAVLNAIENAVRQTSEVYVSKTIPETKLFSKYESKSSGILGSPDSVKEISAGIQTIETTYEGKVKSYKIVSSEEKNDLVYVTIKAVVDIVEDYKSPELVKKASYTLAIMPFDGLKTYQCSADEMIGIGNINSELNASLTAKITQSKKFSVVNRKDLDAYVGEMSIVAGNLTGSKDRNKLQNLASADYMLVGSISQFQSSTNTKTIDVTGEKYSRAFAKMVINYNLIETATMEVIFADTVEASFKKEGESLSCAKVAQKLSDEISANIVSDILRITFPETEAVEVQTIETTQAPVSSSVEQTAKRTVTTRTVTETQKREVVKLPFDN